MGSQAQVPFSEEEMISRFGKKAVDGGDINPNQFRKISTGAQGVEGLCSWTPTEIWRERHH